MELDPATLSHLGDEKEAMDFPSVAWFERLAEIMAARETDFRELGEIDCAMVVKVDAEGGGSKLVEVVFEAFAVKSIRELKSLDEARPEHFVLEAPAGVWREMLENIRDNGAPDLEHTLNYLTFPDVPMAVSGPDQLETDIFYRYNQTLQRFFNGAAGLATDFGA